MLAGRRQALQASIPKVMVLGDLPEKRATYVLAKGSYQAPGEEVAAGFPAAIGPSDCLPQNRLDLARWIVDLHGGDIHPERRDPRGCRMVVTLPSPVPTR